YTLSICAKIAYAFGTYVGSCANNSDGSDEYNALLLVGQNFPDGGTVLGRQAFKPSANMQYTFQTSIRLSSFALLSLCGFFLQQIAFYTNGRQKLCLRLRGERQSPELDEAERGIV